MRYVLRLQAGIVLLLALLVYGAVAFGVAFPGDELAFHIGSIGHFDVHVLDLRTGIQHDLLPQLPNSVSPVWSPDGRQITYFYRAEDGERVGVADGIGQQAHFLGYGHSPTWSPDALRVVFISTGGIYVRDARDGQSTTEVLQPAGVQTYYQAAWSPTGNQMAYVLAPGNVSMIYVFDVLTGESNWLAEGYGPVWSPDGTHIVYTDHLRVMVIAGAGGEPTYVADGFEAAWSPDGEWLVFSRGNTYTDCV